ncbi:MAG: tail fiber protein [Endomicrobiia bacterium]|nr:tail fiber protein [Endomicrobiia bacterium]
MRKTLFLLFAGLTLFVSPAFAEVPNEINYQGRLREYGQPITANRTMNFKIYAIETGGVPVWSSGDVVVAVTTGTFSYAMQPSGVDWRWKDFWLETTVSGKILSPREKIAAGVYALHSRTAEGITKTSGTVTVTIGNMTELAVTTFTVSAENNRIVNVSTPTAYDDGATKGYVESWLPVGTILMWGGTQASIPGGWLLCDGSAISRTTYARLFAAISTVHGVGDGVTTFQLPNLRDRFIVGAGSSYTVGNTGGANTVTLSLSEIPSHNHTGTTGTDGAHTHSYERATITTVKDGSGVWTVYNTWVTGTTSNAGSHGHTINAQGSGGAHENRPPYFALCYIIKI